MNKCLEGFITYLDHFKFELLTEWKEHIKIRQDDIFKMNIKENGRQMYELVKMSLCQEICEEELKRFAYKVAKERLDTNINIGDFVYNVNLGRSILIHHINRSGLPIEEIQQAVDRINALFDQFNYLAVTKYTELKNLEMHEKMLFINQSHKDKLSLLGQMASSFVHEFRNPLTSVIGFLKLLKSEYPDLKYMDTIENELDQLKFRITQFLHVSKVEVVEKKKETISLQALFDEMIKFLYPSIVDGDVLITTKIDNLSVEVYKEEVKQVFLNLILNSIDALKLKESQREITIICSKKEDHISLVVANNGPPIEPEVRRVIFEPFFTTKELGTGIGLYVCKKIVEKHHGTITCESNDELTSFIIKLPLE